MMDEILKYEADWDDELEAASNVRSEIMYNSLWDRRYADEGHIWGDAPSSTVCWLNDELAPKSFVLEVGFGYGRDMIFMLEKQHEVYGIETSYEALLKTAQNFKLRGLGDRMCLMLGRYTFADRITTGLDAVYSHRTLHLMGQNDIEGFVSQSFRVLEPGGLLCVSARDERDFNPTQMAMIEPGVAEYVIPERAGHRVRFWSQEKFSDVFGSHFHSMEFREDTEVESHKNSETRTHFTVLLARRRSEVA